MKFQKKDVAADMKGKEPEGAGPAGEGKPPGFRMMGQPGKKKKARARRGGMRNKMAANMKFREKV